jgi:tungstate transport system substrate-binding protein
MNRLLPWLLPLLLASAFLAAACGDDDNGASGDTDGPARIGGSMILATTTSTFDSGLLDAIVPLFEEQTGVNVKVIAVGTGAALRMAGDGDADAILVHAPAAEQVYVDSGDLVEGLLIMHNDFVIVGPASNPAGVTLDGGLTQAMEALAGATFISRGDDSGTNKRELALWAAAGIDPNDAEREETGQGMGATLNIADQKNAYTLTDRATYLALQDNLDLVILFEGDVELLNIYHVYLVNPERPGGVNERQARAFIEFLVSPETQSVIGAFGVEEFGQPLFIPDAGKTAESLAE